MSGGVRILLGSFTMTCKRTMAGISTTTDADRHTSGSSGIAMASARPASMRTTARRSETSCNGSNVAFNRSTRATEKIYRLVRCWSDHMAYSITSFTLVVPVGEPAAVATRNCQYSRPGSGRNGARRHHALRRRRQAARVSAGTSNGWRTRWAPSAFASTPFTARPARQ